MDESIADIVEDTSLPIILLEKVNHSIQWLDEEASRLAEEYEVDMLGFRPRHLFSLFLGVGVIFLYSMGIFAVTNVIMKRRAKKHKEMKDKLETLDFNLISLEKKKANTQRNFHFFHLIAFFSLLLVLFSYFVFLLYSRDSYTFRPLADSFLLLLLVIPIIGYYVTNIFLSFIQNRKLARMKRQFLDIYKDVLVVKENLERTHELREALMELRKKLDNEWNSHLPKLQQKPHEIPPKFPEKKPLISPSPNIIDKHPVKAQIPNPNANPKPQIPNPKPQNPNPKLNEIVVRKPSDPSPYPLTPDTQPTRKPVYINNSNNVDTPNSAPISKSPFVGAILNLVTGDSDSKNNNNNNIEKKNNNNNNNNKVKKVDSINDINNMEDKKEVMVEKCE